MISRWMFTQSFSVEIHPTYPTSPGWTKLQKQFVGWSPSILLHAFFCIQQLLDGLLIHHLYWFVRQSRTWKYFESRQLRFRAAFPTKSTIRHLSPITNRTKKTIIGDGHVWIDTSQSGPLIVDLNVVHKQNYFLRHKFSHSYCMGTRKRCKLDTRNICGTYHHYAILKHFPAPFWGSLPASCCRLPHQGTKF